MVKRGDPFVYRIDARQIRTLTQIAVDAGRCEILDLVGPAVLTGDNMFHLQWHQRRILLMAPTILATSTGARDHQPACGGGRHEALEVSRRRAMPCNTATKLFART